MRHLVSKPERVYERELMGLNVPYREVSKNQLLPTELYNRGLELVSLEEIEGGDPVILRERHSYRIIAYWDTFPSLTELFELSKELSV